MPETEVLETPAVIDDSTVQPVERAEPVLDKAELEAKVADNLKAVFGDADEIADEPALKEAKEQKETPKEEESATATEETVDETPASAPTLPAAYVRSLKAYDWTEEEIKEAAKQPGFLGTAAKIHANRNKEVASWAEQGRKARQDAVPAQKEQVVREQPATLSPLDADALKKQFGDDKLIDALVGPVNQAIHRMNEMLPVVQQTQKVSEQAKLESLGSQIETFFGGKELEPYKDTYGSMKKGLSETQIQTRNKVLELADATILGAAAQGRNLTLGEALTMAHDSVSSGFKEQAVRTTIKSQMQARNKGITLRPGGQRATPTKVESRKQLERKVGDALAATFGRS